MNLKPKVVKLSLFDKCKTIMNEENDKLESNINKGNDYNSYSKEKVRKLTLEVSKLKMNLMRANRWTNLIESSISYVKEFTMNRLD